MFAYVIMLSNNNLPKALPFVSARLIFYARRRASEKMNRTSTNWNVRKQRHCTGPCRTYTGTRCRTIRPDRRGSGESLSWSPGCTSAASAVHLRRSRRRRFNIKPMNVFIGFAIPNSSFYDTVDIPITSTKRTNNGGTTQSSPQSI